MSILQIMKELEGAPDATLQKIITEGDPRYPGWAATTVASQRADMRDRFRKQEAAHQAEQPKIADREASRLGGGIPDADPNQAGGDPSLATGIAGGMARGGVVKGYHEGEGIEPHTTHEDGVGGGEVEAALTEMEIEEAAVREGISAARGRLTEFDRAAAEWVGNERREGRYVETKDYPAHLAKEEKRTRGGAAATDPESGMSVPLPWTIDPLEMTSKQQRGWDVLLAGAEPGTAEYRDIEQQMNTPVKAGARERARRPEELVPFSAESVLGLDPIYSTTYRLPGDEQERGDEDKDEKDLEELLSSLRANQVSAEGAAARAHQAGYVNQAMGLIKTQEDLAEWNEDDTRLQEMKRNENTILLSQARRVADERGENAEERQEIYDALVKDLKEQRSDMERTERHRRAGDEGRNLANTLANLGKSGGIENVLTYGTAVEAEKEAFRDSLRSLTTEDYDKITGELEGLQTYAAKTGTDLDSAVTAAMRGETGLFRDESQYKEELNQRMLEERTDILKAAIPGAATIDASANRDAASIQAAKIQSRATLKNYTADPNNWGEIEQLLVDAQRENQDDPELHALLVKAQKDLSSGMVGQLMRQFKTGSQTPGMTIDSEVLNRYGSGALRQLQEGPHAELLALLIQQRQAEEGE